MIAIFNILHFYAWFVKYVILRITNIPALEQQQQNNENEIKLYEQKLNMN